MRKWKDNGDYLYSPRTKKLYLIASIVSISIGIFDILRYNAVDFTDVLNLGIGAFLIWSVQFHGGYKIARWLAGYMAKKRDNKWRNYR